MNSFMFVPSKPKMLEKIFTLDADAFIIDLEDSISESNKSQALEDACSFLSRKPNKNIFIRVAGNHLDEEFAKLSKYNFMGYMIPKFENPHDYDQYARFLCKKEIIALVETPKGIVNIKDIAQSNSVSIIAFGGEDFSSSLGMKNCPDTLCYARSVIVTYGKAFGKKVIDTPSFIIDDIDALKKDIQIAVDIGFDGKLCIHPNQVSKINDLFRFCDFDEMEKIVTAYEQSGQAILKIGDKVYEKMHIERYKRILKEREIYRRDK